MMIQIGHQSHVIAFTLQNNYQKYHFFVFVKTPQYTLHWTSYESCFLLCKSTLSQLQFMSQWPDKIQGFCPCFGEIIVIDERPFVMMNIGVFVTGTKFREEVVGGRRT